MFEQGKNLKVLQPIWNENGNGWKVGKIVGETWIAVNMEF